MKIVEGKFGFVKLGVWLDLWEKLMVDVLGL
jgi:hypothetical protein